MANTYGIWASVTGGITGSRTEWLKNLDNTYRTFDSCEEAEQVAADLRESMGKGSKATFSYTVREIRRTVTPPSFLCESGFNNLGT